MGLLEAEEEDIARPEDNPGAASPWAAGVCPRGTVDELDLAETNEVSDKELFWVNIARRELRAG